MKLSSSQRWAIGAVALTVLIACSPKAPEEPSQPSRSAPTLPPETASVRAAKAPAPGFAGEWAFTEADCGKPTSTFKLSSEVINMTPGERSCRVRSISEEHPTGRSATYTVRADCLTEGQATDDKFTINFGAADTVMQLQLNDREPIRLVRCP